MKKILVAGKNGQVGRELQRTLAPLGQVFAVDRETMNLSNPDSIVGALQNIKPDVIVNAAAYTAVDKAESEPDLAMAVNAVAPGIMAEQARLLNALLIHYSTDYVFDGTKPSAYTEDDVPRPQNIYGKTKLAGEHAIAQTGCKSIIFRTSWVYGARGKNFLLTILRLAQEREELKVVDDQIGAPTWSRWIAEASAQVLMQVSERNNVDPVTQEIYHLTAAGQTSWYGFAKAILERVRPNFIQESRLHAITTEDYPLPAKRPGNSVLSSHKLVNAFNVGIPDWSASLELCLDELSYPKR